MIIAKHQTKAPVNVIGIAEDLGLHVWESSQLPGEVSGKIFPDPMNGGASGFSIVVNEREAHVRKRFTIAHEIAHFILHRDLVGNGLVDDVMYRGGIHGALSTKEEIAANKLAADILMPYPLIESLMRQGFDSVDVLASKLEVSTVAMKIRLGLPVT